ncbi:helix-turn-helix domain-containing protein [Xanthomonas theicola]|uniref:HTH araC/xylS-type domain-containing protein n=2 Tax=Xanthomonas theicola TaxID=56464 RepID=A0A2S6ZDU6_9XANT|nr:helix-turn-helix domain-containing protein [Xanthomonas theicola]PPT90441.1 hypothetical protein XthCFBP4691_12240 [Xanthomonas theicola]
MPRFLPESRIMDAHDVKILTKLQAFIDHALGPSPVSCTIAGCEGGNGAAVAAQPASDPTALDGNRLVARFLRMAIDDTPDYRRIASSLRRTEAYSMVSFLLQEGQGAKIEALSARYGISAGHFRRTFRTVLGGSPKSVLNDWRLAKAILAFIERQHSVTEVALEHGFASASHFSSEVKKSLGLSLTHLFDAQRRQ